MKKSILVSALATVLVCASTCVNAYSTADYTVDIPESYKEVQKGVFNETSTGNGFNVQITSYNEKAGDPYTQQMLEVLEQEIFKTIETQKDELEKQMATTYPSMSKQQIKEYVNSFKCNSIDEKEITTCTKNNYKCFHLLANYSMDNYSYYCHQYSIVSGNKTFTVTLSAKNKEDFNNAEMKQILDSFTITNYKAPKKNATSPILYGAIAGAIVGAISGVVISINKKKKQKKDEE